MAAKKKEILKALSAAHLRAIGRVAAQWSALELTLLWAISKVAKVTFSQAIVMAGAQNAEAWCVMLQKITGDTKQPGPGAKATQLDKLATAVQELQAKRNGIVHAAWHSREPIIAGLLSVVEPSPPPKGKDKASGTGIPKRGKKIFTFIEYTSAEILSISNRIEEAENDVYAWLIHWQKVQRIADALKTPSAPHPLLSAQPSLGLLQSPYLLSAPPGLVGTAQITKLK